MKICKKNFLKKKILVQPEKNFCFWENYRKNTKKDIYKDIETIRYTIIPHYKALLNIRCKRAIYMCEKI